MCNEEVEDFVFYGQCAVFKSDFAQMFPLRKISLAKVGQSHSAATSEAWHLLPVCPLQKGELYLTSRLVEFGSRTASFRTSNYHPSF